MYDLFLSFESLPLSIAFAESLFAYPIVLGIHLLALAFAVGLLGLADLRLMGVLLTEYSYSEVLDSLRPWFISGFALVLGSGIVLFLPQASVFYSSTLFWIKILMIALAGLNALYFEVTYRREHKQVSRKSSWLRFSPRASGSASLAFWLTAIVLGRLLAYF